MDNLTHTLVGVLLARSLLGRLAPRATLMCVVAANIPDIDIVTSSSSIDYLNYHRHITHSIPAVPVMAALAVALVEGPRRWLRKGADPPPWLRTWLLAMIAALKAGEIDAVVSAHDPQPPEEKRLPFGEASFGAAGLETTLSALLSLVHDGPLTLLEALAPLTSRPADMIGLPEGRLSEGTPADFILFDPNKPWLCEREHLLSRSTNSPFDGRRLQGRVLKTFVGGEQVFAR